MNCPRCGGDHDERQCSAFAPTGKFAVPTPAAEAADAATRVGASAPMPVPATPTLPPEGRMLGRYRLQQLLGSGGMGVVWKAWDTELERIVALKQIREEEVGSKGGLARFQREARLAARLRHPHLVPVFDVGTVDGKHFLTMEFVDGRAWDAGKGDVGAGADRLRRAVGVLADVSAAVAFAHRSGVIHRDLKPANVLIAADGVPRVTDFGLAKEVGDQPAESARAQTALTVAGQTLGTPNYMSPEQVRGEGARMGPATDVWALGAILYEVLTGETPFERAGQCWDVLGAVVKDEPAAPTARAPGVPRELEAVCLRALEKDPARRYRTAGEFEAELRRWLQGEPVEAQPPSALRRWTRRARRYRATLAGVAALAVLLAVAGYFRLAEGREQEAREQAVREAGRLREQVIAQLRDLSRLCVEETLAARRSGDLEAGKRLRPRLEAAYRRARERLGAPSPEPDFHRGRILRAALDDAGAREAQDRALAIDAEFVPSLYERAVLAARAYADRESGARIRYGAQRGAMLAQMGFLQAGSTADFAVLPPTREQIEAADPELTALREAATGFLQRLTGALGRDPVWREHPCAILRVGDAQVACLRGLLAGLGVEQGGTDVEWLRKAVQFDPWLEEAHEALAAALERAGDVSGAVEACSRGIEQDAGYLPLRLRRMNLVHREAGEASSLGTDLGPHFALAEEDGSAAIACAPDHWDAWAGRGRIRMTWASWERSLGRDSLARLGSAIDDLTRAVEQRGAPSDRRDRGVARMDLADAARHRGEDAAPIYRSAIEDLGAAIEAAPRTAFYWMERAMIRTRLATFCFEKGEDPSASFEECAADFTHALELEPTNADAWLGRAVIYSNWAMVDLRRGVDGTPHLALALPDFQKAAQFRPGQVGTRIMYGQALGRLALQEFNAGKDPEPRFAQALAVFEEVARGTPNHPNLWLYMGGASLNAGICRADRGGDAVFMYERAVEQFTRALAQNPSRAEGWMGRATALTRLGGIAERRGESGESWYDRATQDYAGALTVNPRLVAAWLGRADLWVVRALGRLLRGEAVEPAFDAARADYDRTIELNPALPQAWTGRAYTRILRVTPRVLAGGDASEELGLALVELARTLKLRPGLLMALKLSGRAHGLLAVGRRSAGMDPAREWEQAEAFLAQAIGSATAGADEWYERGWLRLVMARAGERPTDLLAGAVADLSRSLELDPDAPKTWWERGNAYAEWAEELALAGAEFESTYAQALEDYDACLARQPGDGSALASRGSAQLEWGTYLRARGADPTVRWTGARADLELAVSTAPHRWDFRRIRGLLFRRWADWEEAQGRSAAELRSAAIADLEESLRVNPDQPDVQGTLEELRRR